MASSGSVRGRRETLLAELTSPRFIILCWAGDNLHHRYYSKRRSILTVWIDQFSAPSRPARSTAGRGTSLWWRALNRALIIANGTAYCTSTGLGRSLPKPLTTTSLTEEDMDLKYRMSQGLVGAKAWGRIFLTSILVRLDLDDDSEVWSLSSILQRDLASSSSVYYNPKASPFKQSTTSDRSITSKAFPSSLQLMPENLSSSLQSISGGTQSLTTFQTKSHR